MSTTQVSDPTLLLFPLFQASATGDLDGLKRLIASKADVNLPSPFDERTALHLAAATGDLDVTKFLMEEAGAKLSRDRSGFTAIHDANLAGHTEVRSYLQKKQQLLRQGSQKLETQKEFVFELVAREHVFARGAIQSEVNAYFGNLSLHPSYFEHFIPAQIARHIQALMAAKQAAEIRGDEELEFVLKDEHHGFFLSSLHPSPKHRETLWQCDEYLTETADLDGAYSVVYMASNGPAGRAPVTSSVAAAPVERIGIYYVDRQHWEPVTGISRGNSADDELIEETDLQRIATANFLRSQSPESYVIHQMLVEKAVSTRSTVVEVFPAQSFPGGCSRGHVLALGTYEVGGKKARSLLADLHNLLWQANVEPRRFFIQSFANGAVTYILHFPDVDSDILVGLQASVRLLCHTKRTAGLSMQLWNQVMEGTITPEQSIYLRAASKFVYSFFPHETWVPQYAELQKMLHDPQSKRKLDELYLKTAREVITPERIYDVFCRHIDLTPRFFDDFRRIAEGTLKPFWNEELYKHIQDTIRDPLTIQVFQMLLRFNESVLITNFFRAGSPPAAFAFRLNPKVVMKGRPSALFPEVPFGIYLVVGQSFYGFHVRFREISRGGLRLVRSGSSKAYDQNNAMLFEECFNLAYTQQLKNKDIPEGGAKGVLLLDVCGKFTQSVRSGKDCFLKYIDALLDCMLMPDGMTNHCSKEEMLFFGPDEGTADCMDLGARRARDRGYRFWKGLTTGKSVQLGGVPHDVYGITTRGVRTMVQELYKVLNLDERSITKFQTGGPDGDLGSNEILQSCDKTIAIVDGSGVAYDPAGLARPELERLAKSRQMVHKFNKERLGEGGFLVLITDEDVVLPDGAKWRSGMDLRNQFVFTKYAKADLFVPCGGRPGTVNDANIDKLLSGGGSPWKMIVEGANLFFTAQARTRLEQIGVHLIKDSSANKGGVTSSSLEVLASLAFKPKDHEKHMTRACDQADLPEFYLKYVDAIIQRIEDNCRDEFRCIWQATASGEEKSKVEVSKLLSKEINTLTDHIGNAQMSDELVSEILNQAIPGVIIDKLGIEALQENVPEAYLKATVAYWLASKYVYETGMKTLNAFAFHQFMQRFKGNLVAGGPPPSPPSPSPLSPRRPSQWNE